MSEKKVKLVPIFDPKIGECLRDPETGKRILCRPEDKDRYLQGNVRMAFGYTRVSTAYQAKHGQSMEIQEQEIERYFHCHLEPKGFKWGGFFRDPMVSGSKPLLQRTGGAAMNRKLLKGDAVIVTRLDRGFRNTKDMIHTISLWRKKGIGLHLMQLCLDTSEENPLSNLLLTIIAAVSEFERALTTLRCKEGRQKLIDAGYWHSPQSAPWGFRTRIIYVKGRRRHKLVTWPEKVAVGKYIWDLRQARKTCEEVAAILEEARIWREGGVGHFQTPWKKWKVVLFYKGYLAYLQRVADPMKEYQTPQPEGQTK